MSLVDARKNAFETDWKNIKITQPNNLGIQIFNDISIKEIRNYIDWTPFFYTWEMKKKFPLILDDDNFGLQATQ